MKELSEKLLSVIETAEPRLRAINASESAKPLLSGGWSRKQVVAHLIDQIDDSPFDLVQPPENQLYVGWTEPGEWFNLTVRVSHPAVYSVDLLYTSNRSGTISMDVNGKDATGPLAIASTFNASDSIAWRQWHHWNIMPGLVRVRLPAGRTVLTVHILTEGNMNLAYFDFRPSP
jgi:hypothetical protein